MGHFFYKREARQKKVDAEGKVIPLTEVVKKEDGSEEIKVIPGKYEEETVELDDSFNLNKVIRTHMITPTSVIVLLDDGHEVTEKTPQLKNPQKSPSAPGNIIEVKERVWVQSEIKIAGTDVERLYTELARIA